MKTIEEKNRMIAEFMGFKDTFVRNCKGVKYDFDLPNGFELIKEAETTIEGEWCEILMEQDRCMVSDLKFHTSWDWLMPVVEKIEKLGYDFEIHREWATITDMTDAGNFKMIQLNELDKKESTYCCVVEFIEWYNENK